MRHFLFPLGLAFLLSACDENQLNHSMSFSKSGPCTQLDPMVTLSSNVAGDRYTFNACLPDNFDGKAYDLVRKGDSLVLRFPESSQPKSAFALTMDVDAYPPYHFMVINGQAIQVGEVHDPE
jgi:hypothetical protein